MTYRFRHLVNDAIQSSDNTTYEYALPESGNLHSLLVRVRCTNGATAGRNTPPLSIADFVRVVGNGEEKFFELSTQEIEKWMECVTGDALDHETDEAAGAVQYVVFPILFGRKLYDREMYLPLNRVKNPKLQIPYSPTIAADGGFATGTTTFDVTAIWSPDNARLPYLGSLVTRTIKNFTSVASGDEETDINAIDPIRAIGVYAYENQVADGVDINRVRLAANGGEYDVWAGDWDNFMEFNRALFGADIRHDYKLLAQDNDVLDTRQGEIRSFQIQCATVLDVGGDVFSVPQIDTFTGDRLTLDINAADVTAGSESLVTDSTDRIHFVTVFAKSPSYFGLLPYMSPDAPEGYLRPQDYDKLQVILTNGGAGADVRISTQTLKQVQLV